MFEKPPPSKDPRYAFYTALLSATVLLLINHTIGAAISEPRSTLVSRTAKDARQCKPKPRQKFFAE